ncbi:GTP cyclohydrolase II [Pararhodobacter zhoushanensis]|uniref:GTP cyclohydrolase-2 n=1 Tax=Pararhodobacter zhoushanensis TaxID=2479545 RepID=A0ABT3GTM1_9RHOB|nr:GTP cyclohydrolase II [Pararhodobacter zhoushanensis]MCW1930882.1 GTP cyclohydrolase II [Pararhodobacter zhoushanensis]
MSLTPSPLERLNRARADLRMGLPVVLTDGASSALVAAGETLDAARLADLRAIGQPVVALTAHRAATLKARAYDGDIARIVLPGDVGVAWIEALADPADDLTHPMKGPLLSQRDGPAALHRAAIRLVKSAQLLPAAVMVVAPAAADLARSHSLTTLSAEETNTPETRLSPVIAARLPMRLAGAGRLHVFRPQDGGTEHYAVEVGRPMRDAPVLARLHSACFTGDVLGSLKCDCGPQLHAALIAMQEAGSGVLLYLNQEGRGIGLANKMRAYSLQDQGFDTVEANHRLGFEDDERDFRLGAELLKKMGFSQVRLLTNNPRKVAMLQKGGIEVTQRVPLKVGLTDENAAYLATKAAKSGHLL